MNTTSSIRTKTKWTIWCQATSWNSYFERLNSTLKQIKPCVLVKCIVLLLPVWFTITITGALAFLTVLWQVHLMSLWENVHKHHQSLSGDLWFSYMINSLVHTDYFTAAQHHLSPPRNREDFLDNVAGSSFKRHCQWSSNLFGLKQNWNERAIQWVSEVKELVTNKYPIHKNKLLLTGLAKSLSLSLSLSHTHTHTHITGLPRCASGKEPTCKCRRHKRPGFDPWVGKILWRRTWQSTPVYLPGESHRQKSLTGYIS